MTQIKVNLCNEELVEFRMESNKELINCLQTEILELPSIQSPCWEYKPFPIHEIRMESNEEPVNCLQIEIHELPSIQSPFWEYEPFPVHKLVLIWPTFDSIGVLSETLHNCSLTLSALELAPQVNTFKHNHTNYNLMSTFPASIDPCATPINGSLTDHPNSFPLEEIRMESNEEPVNSLRIEIHELPSIQSPCWVYDPVIEAHSC